MQYTVFWVNLDGSQGSEMQKRRPCVVLSPDNANNKLRTVMAAPITSAEHKGIDTRVFVKNQYVSGYVALDQMRVLDKTRLTSESGKLSLEEISKIKDVIQEYLVLC